MIESMHKVQAALVIIALLLAGCAQKPATPEKPTKYYTINGVVKELDKEHKTAVIEHQEIVGWMEAMTMEFPIRDDAEFAKLSVGAKMTAKVNVQDVQFWLSDVKILQ